MTRSFERGASVPELFGDGTSQQTGVRLKGMGVKKCMVVSDKGVQGAGIVDEIVKTIADAGIEYMVYTDAASTSDIDCMEATKVYEDYAPDCVLAIGGGAVMDLSKMIIATAHMGLKAEDLYKYSTGAGNILPANNKGSKFVIIPTTSGTSAESTFGAVITETASDGKLVIVSESMKCDFVIVDPLLTMKLPAAPTTVLGLDAITHVVENLVGSLQCDFFDLVQCQLLKRMWQWLPIVVEEPDNLFGREQMSLCSHEALNNGFAGQGHGFAHSIGGKYHILHGICCAYVLPSVIRHHANTATRSIFAMCEAVGVPTDGTNEEVADHLARAWIRYCKSLGVTKSLKDEIASRGYADDRDTFIKKVVDDTIKYDGALYTTYNPPIHLNREDIECEAGKIYDTEW